MTKTLIDIPDELLAGAMAVLGTTTKADTVRTALERITVQRRAVEFFDWIAETDALGDLNDAEVKARARG